MEPMRKVGIAWFALIILLMLVMLLYFLRFSKCQSVDFVCDHIKLKETEATLYIRNHLFDVDIMNITSSCRLVDWNINGKFQYYRFELNKEIELNVHCRSYFENMNLTLIYMDLVTNLTHTDLITIKR